MEKVLVVDGNNLAFKSFIVMHDSTGQLRNNAGVATTVIFGILRMLSAYTDKNPVDKTVICWDGGSEYRKKIFPWYKWNRKIGGEPEWMPAYYEELKNARYYFEKMCIPQLSIKGIEGDDLVGYMAYKFMNEGNRAVIMSDDKDFYQLSKPRLKIYRPTKMKTMTHEEVVDELGFAPYLQPRIKAFTGEDGDNIPGTGDLSKKHLMQKVGVGPGKALKLLTKSDGTFYKVGEACDAVSPKDRHASLIRANKKQILTSYKLARIRTRDEWYMDWELKELTRQYKRLFVKPELSHGQIKNIADFLDFKIVALPIVLKQLGVFK